MMVGGWGVWVRLGGGRGRRYGCNGDRGSSGPDGGILVLWARDMVSSAQGVGCGFGGGRGAGGRRTSSWVRRSTRPESSSSWQMRSRLENLACAGASKFAGGAARGGAVTCSSGGAPAGGRLCAEAAQQQQQDSEATVRQRRRWGQRRQRWCSVQRAACRRWGSRGDDVDEWLCRPLSLYLLAELRL
jgi:hypothetical protein